VKRLCGTAVVAIAFVTGGCFSYRPCRTGTVLLTFDAAGSDMITRMEAVIAIDGKQSSSFTTAITGARGTLEIDFPSGYVTGSRFSVRAAVFAGDHPRAKAMGFAAAMLTPGCSALTVSLAKCGFSVSSTDVYVDPAALAGGDGSAACPLGTISAGVELARTLLAPAKLVHIAEGRYSAPQETFPIVLIGGVTVVGAGVGKTVVEGFGLSGLDDSAPREALLSAGNRLATFEIGDSSANGISSLTLQPPSNVTSPEMAIGSAAVQCAGGNLRPLSVMSDPLQAPPPNTILADLQIGPNYEAGILVDNGQIQDRGGCNLEVRNTTVTGNYLGLVVHGGAALGLPTAITLGNATKPGNNFFANLQNPLDCRGSMSTMTCNNRGGGLLVDDSAYLIRVFGNALDTDDSGVWLGYQNGLHPTKTSIDIENNTFTGVKNDAFVANIVTAVDVFSGNTIVGANRGIHLAGKTVIKKARHNSITNCYGPGILIADLPATHRDKMDFGTADDWGYNLIACNENDLYVDERPDGMPDGLLSFVGNFWDRVPPSSFSLVGGPPPNVAYDVDIINVSTSPLPAIDVDHSMRNPNGCPFDHQP
jgi:hypothetical protein